MQMDFCNLTPIRRHTQTVVVWNTPTDRLVLVFVGHNFDPELKRAIEEGSKLDETQKARLKAEFGSTKYLSIPPAPSGTTQTIRLVEQFVFDDDTCLVLRWKLAKELGLSSPNELFLWNSEKPIELEYLDAMLKPVEITSNPFEASIDPQFVNEAGDYLPTLQLLSHEKQLLQDTTVFATTASAVYQWHSDPQTKENRIFYGIIKKYFPALKELASKVSKSNTTVYDALSKNDEIVASVYYTPFDSKNILQSECGIKRLYFRIRPKQTETQQFVRTFPLLFNNLRASNKVPYIEYRDFNNNYYKVYKPALGYRKSGEEHKLQLETLKEWIDPNKKVFKKIKRNNKIAPVGVDNIDRRNRSLRFKVHFKHIDGLDRYFTVILHDTGFYDIKFSLSSDTLTDLDFKEALQNTRLLLEEVSRLISPDINGYFYILNWETFLNPPSYVEILDTEASFNLTFGKKTVSFKKAVALLDDLSFLEPNGEQRGENCNYKFKRVSNYTNMDNIAEFMNARYTLPKEELIQAIQEAFTISVEDATKAYEERSDRLLFDVYKNGKQFFYKPELSSGIHIEMSRLGDQQISGKLTNFRSVSVLHRIIKTVCLVWTPNGLPTVSKLTKKNRGALEEATVAMTKPVITLKAVQETIDEQEDDFGDYDLDLEVELSPSISAPPIEEDGNDNEIEFELGGGAGKNTNDLDDETDNALDFNLSDIENDEEKQKKYYKKMYASILKSLIKADKELFRFKTDQKKSYPSVCGAVDKRQPVVITDKEKEEIDTKHPGSYTTYIKTGSSPNLENKYYYICPKIWCPLSKVSLTPEELKANGNRCPAPVRELPLILHSNYWTKKTTGENGEILKSEHEHHPGFLKKETHPDGLLLPCCFKKELKTTKEIKKPVVVITEEPKEVEEVLDEPEEPIKLPEQQVKERYILKETGLALEEERYGLLPEHLAMYFKSDTCSGLVKDDTPCMVRKGIRQDPQSFLTCMVYLMKNPRVSSVADLLKVIETKLTVFDFMKLNNGNTLKTFFHEHEVIHEKENYQRFRNWFLDEKQSAYVTQFHIRRIKKAVSEMPDAFDSSHIYAKEIQREYIIYNAYTNFLYYLNSGVFKTHEDLLDLFSNKYEWLNTNAYNLVLFEENAESTVMHCPKYIGIGSTVDYTRPFVFIIKTGKYYEPVVHVTFHKGTVKELSSFNYNSHELIQRIVHSYIKSCKNPTNKEVKETKRFVNNLYSHGVEIQKYVINTSFKVVGILETRNIFIPFQSQVPLLDYGFVPVEKFIYVQDLYTVKTTVEASEVKRFFGSLAKWTETDNYKIKSTIRNEDDPDNVVAFRLKNNQIVPVHVGSQFKNILQSEFDDIDIFIGQNRTEIEYDTFEYNAVFQKVIRSILLDEEKAKKLKHIRHPQNPLPDFVKQRILETLVSRPDLKQAYIDNMVDELLYKDPYYIFQETLKNVRSNEDDIVFDQYSTNIVDATHQRLINPYRYTETSIEDYIIPVSVRAVDVSKVSVSDLVKDNLVEIRPAKWQIVLPTFQMYMQPKTHYDNEYILDLFYKASRETKTRVTKKAMKDFLHAEMVKDFSRNKTRLIQELLLNESFSLLVREITSENLYNLMTLEDLLRFVNSPSYKFSYYELKRLAKLNRINLVFVGRQRNTNNKFPNGFRCIYNSSLTWMLFHIDFQPQYEYYSVLVRDNKHILHSSDNFSVEFNEQLKVHCSKTPKQKEAEA
jgi:hypothetical protein